MDAGDAVVRCDDEDSCSGKVSWLLAREEKERGRGLAAADKLLPLAEKVGGMTVQARDWLPPA